MGIFAPQFPRHIAGIAGITGTVVLALGSAEAFAALPDGTY
ncbi:hypothetical protein [Streptomyces sp. Ag109_G2-15]|nr:hypothetical protein [Streptomyces sp. Ag109_G2-15]